VFSVSGGRAPPKRLPEHSDLLQVQGGGTHGSGVCGVSLQSR
jgi:hypothetical protein